MKITQKEKKIQFCIEIKEKTRKIGFRQLHFHGNPLSVREHESRATFSFFNSFVQPATFTYKPNTVNITSVKDEVENGQK